MAVCNITDREMPKLMQREFERKKTLLSKDSGNYSYFCPESLQKLRLWTETEGRFFI